MSGAFWATPRLDYHGALFPGKEDAHSSSQASRGGSLLPCLGRISQTRDSRGKGENWASTLPSESTAPLGQDCPAPCLARTLPKQAWAPQPPAPGASAGPGGAHIRPELEGQLPAHPLSPPSQVLSSAGWSGLWGPCLWAGSFVSWKPPNLYLPPCPASLLPPQAASHHGPLWPILSLGQPEGEPTPQLPGPLPDQEHWISEPPHPRGLLRLQGSLTPRTDTCRAQVTQLLGSCEGVPVLLQAYAGVTEYLPPWGLVISGPQSRHRQG